VQINTIRPALAPGQIEAQVTLCHLKTVPLGRHPGADYTRSSIVTLSNGFSQSNRAIFSRPDRTLYFARAMLNVCAKSEDCPKGWTPMMCASDHGSAAKY